VRLIVDIYYELQIFIVLMPVLSVLEITSRLYQIFTMLVFFSPNHFHEPYFQIYCFVMFDKC